MDATLQSVIERIEHTIADYETSGRVPDRFANDYLAHALTCLSNAQYSEANEHLQKGIDDALRDESLPPAHAPLTLAEHRARFEELKACMGVNSGGDDV
jgi:hypothetical protein